MMDRQPEAAAAATEVGEGLIQSDLEYTDKEILQKVHALRRHGYGKLTIEAFGHRITELEELNRHRKVPHAGK
jgi:biotin operon repressor